MEKNQKNLYFEPEIRNNKEREQKGNKMLLKLVIFICFIVVVVVAIIWFLKGNTTSSGNYPDNIRNESLLCTTNMLTPPKIDSIDSNDKKIEINAIYNNDASLKRIYFTYIVNYSSEDEAYGNEAKSHAFFNKALAASGYPTDKFSNKFTRYGNSLKITLSAENGDIDSFSAPYFMLDSDSEKLESLTTEKLRKNYEDQGFKCKTSSEQ